MWRLVNLVLTGVAAYGKNQQIYMYHTSNPFMHTVEKWPSIASKSYGVHTAISFKYV